MKFPVTSSNQYAPLARCPAGMIALRDLMEMPITFDSSEAFRSSSPSVLTSRRLADAGSPSVHLGPFAAGEAPTVCSFQSQTLVTTCPSARSYHVLPTIPLVAGIAPDMKMLWPTAVTVGDCP